MDIKLLLGNAGNNEENNCKPAIAIIANLIIIIQNYSATG
jgi:hypothetical protein